MLVDRLRLKEINDSIRVMYNLQLELNNVKDKLIQNQNNVINLYQSTCLSQDTVIMSNTSEIDLLKKKVKRRNIVIKVLGVMSLIGIGSIVF
jgi:glucose uptake protein GlcU